MAEKTMCFDLSSSSIKIKELMQTKDFIKIELWAISDEYPNNNTSHFPYATMQTNVNDKVFYNKPILGKFNNITLNYEVHNSQNKYDPEYNVTYKDYENGERPLGVIRESDDVRIETDENGLHWIVFTAVLWVKYNYQGVKKILKSKTSKVSVEVTVYESHEDENGIEIFDKWMFDGVTILGYRPNTQILAKEGINNAHLTILEKMGQSIFSHQIKSLQFAYDEFDKNKDIKENNSHLYIEKNEEEEGIELLTYEQKRDLLQEKLSSFLSEKEWGYVCDLTEDTVYFRVDDVTYRASYSFNDEETEVSMNYDEKIRVINSWQDFEEDENKDENFEENESNDQDFENGKDVEHEAQEDKPEEKDESSEEDKDDCKEKTCEKDSEEKVDLETNNDEKSEDECKGKTCEENPEEKIESEDDNPNDSEDKDDVDKDCPEEKEESEIDGQAFADENKKQENPENDDDSKGDDKNCYDLDEEGYSEQKFIIDGTEYTAQDIFDKYTEQVETLNNLQHQYNNLSTEFENCKQKCKDYETQLKEIECSELGKKVKEMMMKLSVFSDEEIQDFVDRCGKGEFSSFEEATKEVAYQKLMKENNDNALNNNENQTEFSAKADVRADKKTFKSNKKVNSFDKLKEYINK